MKLFCGIAFQTNDINITVIDDKQTEILNENVPIEASHVIATLAPHRRDLVSIVMEARHNPEWLMEALKAEGFTNVFSVEE